MTNSTGPLAAKERFAILDILRGIALLGICLANFGELSLYTFQPEQVSMAMPTAGTDNIIRFFQYFLIDGKFYTLFSLLFGIGFSIILENCEKSGRNGIRVFYRRMIILAIIGLAHLILLWAGDILLLYALLGMLLPLFRKMSNGRLLIFAVVLLLAPIAMDTFSVLSEGRYSLMIPVNHAIDNLHGQSGITPENFGIWLRDRESYGDVLRFNLAGSFIRAGEFIEGNRVFKVLGLFLLGLYIGRKRIFADLAENKPLLRQVRNWGFTIGIPTSLLYAWNAVVHYPAGMVGSTAIYTVSVVPMGLAYAASIALWYEASRNKRHFNPVAQTGRMALTNYIGQSVAGMIIYYGIGFSLGASMGLAYVELVALGVFALQMILSNLWLHWFRYGPLEWIWRMLTYGKLLKLIK
ncbi:MAG: DUF418 domain-containing protein [Oscillospiraceae bacterium]|nr:DUF418 domain-containing protein [Oscillospiraceae bacterium]